MGSPLDRPVNGNRLCLRGPPPQHGYFFVGLPWDRSRFFGLSVPPDYRSAARSEAALVGTAPVETAFAGAAIVTVAVAVVVVAAAAVVAVAAAFVFVVASGVTAAAVATVVAVASPAVAVVVTAVLAVAVAAVVAVSAAAAAVIIRGWELDLKNHRWDGLRVLHQQWESIFDFPMRIPMSFCEFYEAREGLNRHLKMCLRHFRCRQR